MSNGRRAVTAICILVLMAGFGAGVNRFLASRTSGVDAPATNPTKTVIAPQLALPGTIYFADGGGLFALKGTSVTQLQPEGQGWTQPVPLPNGTGLLAVKVTANYYSNLYELSLSGQVMQQLSHNSGKVTATSLGNDDWIFYPAVAANSTLYFSYDYPKRNIDDQSQCCYQVDYSIWSTTLGTNIDRSNVVGHAGITQQSWANYYTGGDVSPVPLTGGGLIYVDYETAYGGSSQLSQPFAGAAPGTEVSQIRMDPRPVYGSQSAKGTALTAPQDDCAQPSLNPAQTEIAMVCTPVVNGAPSSTEADLVVASFDAQTGTIGTFTRLVTGTMAAVPAWSPDGKSLVYLAPEPGDGYFELWYIKNAATAHAAHSVQVTNHLDMDASAAPQWSAG